MKLIKTAERVSHLDTSDNFVFQRSLLVYKMAAKMLSGRVLEIGTGSGYGIAEISPFVDEFWTIDKHDISIDYNQFTNTRFIKKKVPPLKQVPKDYFDYVICFQVIEHINDDDEMLREIESVLKNKGKLIISTPNIEMSITKNPWHVREYTIDEFNQFLSRRFHIAEKLGVFGDNKTHEYYLNNKKSVNKILKYDIFKLNKRLPRWSLKIPYDILNRINRNILYQHNYLLAGSITIDNYIIKPVSPDCYDLFYIVQKQNVDHKIICQKPTLALTINERKNKAELMNIELF